MTPTKAGLAGLTLSLVSAVPLSGCSNESTTTTTTAAGVQVSAKDHERAVTELNEATTTLQEMRVSDLVPGEWLARTECAVIIPALASGAFIVGASHGTGVATCRTQAAWSAPIFVSLSGASAGAQIGGQSSDVLMLVTSKKGEASLFASGGFKLGGEMSVAAGPTGAGKTKGGDVNTDADIVTYARSKGLFAGVQLSGMSLGHDDDATNALYGHAVGAQTVLNGGVAAPAEAHAFLEQIRMTFPAHASVASSE